MERTEHVHRDIREFLNSLPLGGKQWTVFLVCFAATAIEGFDTIVIGFLAPAISHDWQLPGAALAPLVASGLSGLLIGSIVGGTMADRIGRRLVSIAAIAWFGVAGLASSDAHTISQLIVWRFITGLGIGAAMPALAALVAEYSPDRSRSVMLASTYCGFLFGAAVSGFATAFAIGTLGWKGVLLLSGLMPLCVMVLLMWLVPESPLYMVSTHLPDMAVRKVLTKVFPAIDCSGISFIIAPPQGYQRGTRALLGKEYRGGTLLTWIAEFAGYLVFFLIGSWLPTHLKHAGLSMQDASQVSSLFQFGALAGAVIFAVLVRRYNVASVIAGAFGAGAPLVVALGISEATPWHAGAVFLAGLAVGGPLICVNTIPGIFYPTALRASGAGWNVAIGRLGSIVGSSLIGVIVISGIPYLLTCALLSIPLLIACVCMTAMAPVLSVQRRMLSADEEGVGMAPVGDASLTNGATRQFTR